MKKIKVAILTIMVGLSFASPICVKGAEMNEFENIEEVKSSEGLDNNVSELQNIHKLALQEGKCVVKNGHYEIVEDINISGNYMKEYEECINNINQIIDLGVAYIDDNNMVKTKSQEETAEIIYNRDKSIRDGEIVSDNDFDAIIDFEQEENISIGRAAALPTLHAYSIALNNKATLQNYWNTMASVAPESAYASAVGWWIGKVQSGGAWDYKSVSGYAPYNRRWNATQKNITVVRTSEWFGNYNYGFTGKLLFTENILLLGGDGVSLVFNHQIDDQADKDAIRTGYGES